ncbi:MAG: type II toxin-antitoxin system VapC family toxin [Ktedonobacteraceae bacterium]
MSVLFFDTPALIKRYLAEKGCAWVRAQCHANAGHTIVISQATSVEAVAALCRKGREINPAQRITLDERDKQIRIFREDTQLEYFIIPVTASIYEKAGDLCRTHQLRAYDAIQLACALTSSDKLARSGEPAPIFVSADDKLLEIARAEGFTIENPNHSL